MSLLEQVVNGQDIALFNAVDSQVGANGAARIGSNQTRVGIVNGYMRAVLSGFGTAGHCMRA